MAEPLTRDQMEFLAKKLGYEISYYSSEVREDLNNSLVLLTDGTLRPFKESDHNFWEIRVYQRNNFDARRNLEILATYVWDSRVNDRRSDSYIKLIPKDFIPVCKKYFGGTPLYVGTKRVNQAICKVGGVLKTVQGIYVKQDGSIKKIM